MKILMVTSNDSKGVTLAEMLSQSHQITVLHTGKIRIECPFEEAEINDSSLRHFQFDGFQNIVYLASDKLPCSYLVTLLHAIKDTPAIRCICIAEKSLNLSAEGKDSSEKYICRGFRNQMRAMLSFWSISPLYGDDFFPDELMGMLVGRVKNNRIVLPGSENQVFDAMHVTDLAKAIEYYVTDNRSEPEVFLSSGQISTFRELGEALRTNMRQANIEYGSSPVSENTAMIEGAMAGWMPERSFLTDLASIVRSIEIEGSEVLHAERSSLKTAFLRILSFTVLFVLVCSYTGFIRTSSELQFVDVRLLFIISMCLFLGKRYGLAAAVLCSIASVGQSILSGTQWHVIFFHIDNWIPMAVYLASAVLFGMYQENHSPAAAEQTQEQYCGLTEEKS